MEEHEFAYACLSGQRDGVVNGRVTEVADRRKLFHRVLGIVEEEIGASAQLKGSVVNDTEPVVSFTPLHRPVVGHVDDRGTVISDAVAERATSLVRNLERKDVEALDVVRARFERAERPRAAEARRTDREVRGAHHLGKNSFRVALRREIEVDAGVGSVTGSEERQPVDVIPMEMRKQDGAVERQAVEHLGEASEAAARIEDERGSGIATCDGHARCVPAVAHLIGPGHDARAADAMELQPHEGSLRGEDPRSWSIGRPLPRHRQQRRSRMTQCG